MIFLEIVTIIVAVVSSYININATIKYYNLQKILTQYQIPKNLILVGSNLQDRQIEKNIDVSGTITVKNNLQHATPIHIELSTVSIKKDSHLQPIISGYYISNLKPNESIVNPNSESNFDFSVKMDESGEYKLTFIVYFEYNQESKIYYGGYQRYFEFKLFITDD